MQINWLESKLIESNRIGFIWLWHFGVMKMTPKWHLRQSFRFCQKARLQVSFLCHENDTKMTLVSIVHILSVGSFSGVILVSFLWHQNDTCVNRSGFVRKVDCKCHFGVMKMTLKWHLCQSLRFCLITRFPVSFSCHKNDTKMTLVSIVQVLS